MATETIFLHLILILLSARILGELAVRVGIPAVIGEVMAGIFIGPSLLGWLEPNQTLRFLAEIGIILLLFKIGLETDIGHLLRTGRKSLIVALAGFTLPFLLCFHLSYLLFQLPLTESLFIGGTMTATSIGITLRVLADLGHQRSHEGQIVLGAAVIDDILGVLLLALIYEFASAGTVSMGNSGKFILFIGAFFLIAPAAAQGMSRVIKRFDERSEIPGLLPTTVLSLVLFFAWLAHAMGAPVILGGFAAGLALSRRFFLPFGIAIRQEPHFSQRIANQMHSIVYLFTPIFFVMVGLSLDLSQVHWSSPMLWPFTLALLMMAIAGKLMAALFIAESRHKRLIIGLSMVPRGEVGLVFAELGREMNIVDLDIYASLIIVIGLTTLLTPFFLKLLYNNTTQD